MNDTQITIRTNSETKAKAQELFNSLGLDLSTAINMFINESLDFQGIPFVVRRYNGSTEQAVADAQTIGGLNRSYVNADEPNTGNNES